MIALITWLQYYKLKPLQPLFSRCENDCFIAHAFLSNKYYQSCSKSEKLIQISPVRTITSCNMHKSNSCFCTSLNTLGEIIFRSKLRLKTTSTNQIFSFGNCRLGKKRRSKVVGTFRKFLEWGEQKPSVTDLEHKQLSTWLL